MMISIILPDSPEVVAHNLIFYVPFGLIMGVIYPLLFTPILLAVHTYVYIKAWLWSWTALCHCHLPYLVTDYCLTLGHLPLLLTVDRVK